MSVQSKQSEVSEKERMDQLKAEALSILEGNEGQLQEILEKTTEIRKKFQAGEMSISEFAEEGEGLQNMFTTLKNSLETWNAVLDHLKKEGSTLN